VVLVGALAVATLGWPDDTDDLRSSPGDLNTTAATSFALGEPDDLRRPRADGRCAVPRVIHSLGMRHWRAHVEEPGTGMNPIAQIEIRRRRPHG
jgi:hypothetical protein